VTGIAPARHHAAAKCPHPDNHKGMPMKTLALTVLNLTLVLVFLVLLKRRDLLTYSHQGRVWLTYLAVAVITLMDEFTSIFYAPAEAYRFLGPSAMVFIALTSLLIRFMCTRLTEIAEILERYQLIGGGVYSFSYLILGPMVSFVAVSSIMVSYVLTACISAVSAVANATSFFPLSSGLKLGLVLALIWTVAGLNILGLRENARFTFMVFMVATFILLNLVVSGLLALDRQSLETMRLAAHQAAVRLQADSWVGTYDHFISSIAFCILAYSGVESVLQTAGLVRSWQEIRRAYLFLALTVGLVTPLVAILALSAPIDFQAHEGDLITHYATLLNGAAFGGAVAGLASFTLMMAINTAFLASSELLERVAHRYGFHWLIVTNRRQSLYRIHLLNAFFFSAVILVTQGSQALLADMYALGLIASFCINMGSLIIYRYFQGTKEITYYTSRLGTVILWIILVSCFVFLALDKHYATLLWASVTLVVLAGGFSIARTRGPELQEIAKADTEMGLVLYLAQSEEPVLHLVFRRTPEDGREAAEKNIAYVTFYSPRMGRPEKLQDNHFCFPLHKLGVFQQMVSLLRVLEYEFPHKKIIVHLGWPMSSWLDRLSIGVLVFNLMRLPRFFPTMEFVMRSAPSRS